MSASGDWDDDSSYASSSTDSTIDEDELNVRVYPDWITQRHIIECSGVYRLDTRRDVREHYEQYCPSQENAVGYQRACGMKDDDELCRDAGLVGSLYLVNGCLSILISPLARKPIPRVSCLRQSKNCHQSCKSTQSGVVYQQIPRVISQKQRSNESPDS